VAANAVVWQALARVEFARLTNSLAITRGETNICSGVRGCVGCVGDVGGVSCVGGVGGGDIRDQVFEEIVQRDVDELVLGEAAGAVVRTGPCALLAEPVACLAFTRRVVKISADSAGASTGFVDEEMGVVTSRAVGAAGTAATGAGRVARCAPAVDEVEPHRASQAVCVQITRARLAVRRTEHACL
jgi:hypothetical protein